MSEPTDDSIYLEPGSVWRRRDDFRILRGRADSGMLRFDAFDGSQNYLAPHNWLDWAKHPDTVLVYSPSGNKLPPKPWYVRVRAPVVVQSPKEVYHGHEFKTIEDLHENWACATDPHRSGGGDGMSIGNAIGIASVFAFAAFIIGLCLGLLVGMSRSDAELVNQQPVY